jgi:hypothetical protein
LSLSGWRHERNEDKRTDYTDQHNHDLHGFGFGREIGLLPAIPASDQGSCFGPTCLSKFLRHTGAGSFVWSSAVGN